MERAMFFLEQKDMPTHWYNVLPDLPEPLPPLRHPGTKEVLPLDMPLPPPLVPDAINRQEFSTERYIEIPDEVQEAYRTYRPTVLHRAYRLEKYLDTP
ncbi:MAG TPA: TrpB-like pyridoxal-phosphate dependent enzyme, partial [Dehalococcoidales bacterium]|nr:TrpB-like pyridoxal-phosphate dependent enzyme [Dehalococcoidales bacterium]